MFVLFQAWFISVAESESFFCLKYSVQYGAGKVL